MNSDEPHNFFAIPEPEVLKNSGDLVVVAEVNNESSEEEVDHADIGVGLTERSRKG